MIKYIRLILFKMKPRNMDDLRYKFHHRKKAKTVNPWAGIRYDETDVKCIEWVNSL